MSTPTILVICLGIFYLPACTAQKYECVTSQSPSVRTFNTIKDYQGNKIKFDAHNNSVAFSTNMSLLETNMFVTYDSEHIGKLILERRGVVFVSEGAFNQLYCLNALLLAHNLIVEIYNGTFDGLPNVGTIDLSHNLIRVVPKNAFWNIRSLNVLLLSHNKIVYLFPESLTSLTFLVQLDLDHNRIVHLPLGFFEPTRHLMRLNLSANALTRPTRAEFGNLTLLNVLDLSENQIDTFELNFFESMPELLRLNIARNKLSQLNELEFHSLREIEMERNLWSCADLTEYLKHCEDSRIGVVVNNTVLYKDVNTSDIGCHQGDNPSTTTSTTTSRPSTTTETPGLSPNDRISILLAVNDLKTVVLILIILIVVFNVIDIMIRTNAFSRCQCRQNGQFTMPTTDADVPLLMR